MAAEKTFQSRAGQDRNPTILGASLELLVGPVLPPLKFGGRSQEEMPVPENSPGMLVLWLQALQLRIAQEAVWREEDRAGLMVTCSEGLQTWEQPQAQPRAAGGEGGRGVMDMLLCCGPLLLAQWSSPELSPTPHPDPHVTGRLTLQGVLLAQGGISGPEEIQLLRA